MPKTLGIWEWGWPKRGDAQNAVTPRGPKAREKRPGDEVDVITKIQGIIDSSELLLS